MTKMSFGQRGKKIQRTIHLGNAAVSSTRSAEDIVREMKTLRSSEDAGYRERSLAIHGLICARCGREFDGAKRHLLTVHHKNGNHRHNPPDGSNWENLCVYCHEDVHSREVLGEYLDGSTSPRDVGVAYRDERDQGLSGQLADQLRRALQKKNTF